MPPSEPRKHRTGWRRCKSDRPTEILDATVQIVRERGCNKVRMSDIAARAGITKGTIYLYFESKEALLKMLNSDKTINRANARI